MALPRPGKRGRPRKDDPRHLQRKAEEEAHQLRLRMMQAEWEDRQHRKKLPTGVSNTDTRKFQARIKLDGKRFNLGSFDTAEEAAEAYNNAKAAGFTCRDSPQKYAKRGVTIINAPPGAHEYKPRLIDRK